MSSDFENLPLPVNRDAQDYSRLVPPNSAVEIPVVGEFVYCKFSDGSIRVVINGKSTLMESGDERRSGGTSVFRGVTLINDTDYAKAVVFVIGFGKFDRKIIQGEIVVDPRVKTGSGIYVADTRDTHPVTVNIDYKRSPEITRGDETNLTGNLITGSNRISSITRDYVTKRLFFVAGKPSSFQVFEFVESSGQVIAYAKRDGDSSKGTRASVVYDNILYTTDADAQVVRAWNFDGSGTGSAISPVLGSASNDMCISKNGEIYVSGFGSKLFKLDGGGWVELNTPLSTSESLITINGNLAIFSGQSNTLTIFSDEFKTVIKVYNGINTTFSPIPKLSGGSDWIYPDRTYDGSDFGFEIKSREMENIAAGILHYGRASERCLVVGNLYNPAMLSSVRTRAAVTISFENNVCYVSGQVIKLILDLLGIATTGDYLDGITGVQFKAKSINANIDLGGRTFAADGIEDNFLEIEFPQTVKITALNSLWSNR
jgi:hypothetical protein